MAGEGEPTGKKGRITRQRRSGNNAGGGHRRRAEERRDWSGLPDLVLSSVAGRLTTLADLISFRLVCRSWKPAAETAERAVLASLPPLLAGTSVITFYSLLERRIYRRNGLDLLERDGYTVVGHTLGYLVLRASGPRFGQFLLVNPFTGERFGGFPRSLEKHNCFVLSSSPTSPDCTLLAFDRNSIYLQYCRPGDEKWTPYRILEGGGILQVAVLGGKFYILGDMGKLAVFDTIPHPNLTPLGVERLSRAEALPFPGEPDGEPSVLETIWRSQPQSETFLGESGGDLLAIQMVRHDFQLLPKVRQVAVHRCDLSRGKWVRLERLGGRRALFVSAYMSSAVSADPTGWGGSGNRIYFVDHSHKSLGVFRMKGRRVKYLRCCDSSHLGLDFCGCVRFWVLPG